MGVKGYSEGTDGKETNLGTATAVGSGTISINNKLNDLGEFNALTDSNI